MKTYHQNGTVSELPYILESNAEFAIQKDFRKEHTIFFYPGDNLIREIESELDNIYHKFIKIYFANMDSYYEESLTIPLGLALGGQNSDVPIDKEYFLQLSKQFAPNFANLHRHLYVADCQYLISTVQNLLQSAEHCFIQYYIQLSQVSFSPSLEDGEYMTSSDKTMELAFLLETFFTKLYSILDLMVKIVYELQNPNESFSSITKLKSAPKLWGDRKELNINNAISTIFEDCEIVRQIEALRNEAVHNGTWEFRPKVFFKVESANVVERYMLFPDFENGRLATVKNRRHFFSTETKVNEMLVLIHDEFYTRLWNTLEYINHNL